MVTLAEKVSSPVREKDSSARLMPVVQKKDAAIGQGGEPQHELATMPRQTDAGLWDKVNRWSQPRSQPIRSKAPQAKLEIGKPNDKYEQEADLVAEKVIGMTGALPAGHHSGNMVRHKTDGSAEGNETAGLEQKLSSTSGSGRELEPGVRSYMEPRIGADFSNVKVHTGTDAVQMNKDMGSHAFAHKNNIYFNEGRYQPDTESGKKLLAHELTHTVQQGAAVQRKENAGPKTIAALYATVQFQGRTKDQAAKNPKNQNGQDTVGHGYPDTAPLGNKSLSDFAIKDKVRVQKPIVPMGAKPLEKTSIDPLEAAYLADNVYGGKAVSAAPEHWEIVKLTIPLIGNVKIESRGDARIVDEKTGFKAALYKNTVTEEYAFVTAGTELSPVDKGDVVNDVEQFLGLAAGQYEESTLLARIISDQLLAGKRLTFIGHSLGGGLAAANALATGRPAITFNAAGLKDKTKKRYNLNRKASIDDYEIKGQILYYEKYLGLKPEGVVHLLDDKGNNDMVKKHMMKIVIQALKDQRADQKKQQKSHPFFYYVKNGENWDSISTNFHIKKSELVRLNGKKEPESGAEIILGPSDNQAAKGNDKEVGGNKSVNDQALSDKITSVAAKLHRIYEIVSSEGDNEINIALINALIAPLRWNAYLQIPDKKELYNWTDLFLIWLFEMSEANGVVSGKIDFDRNAITTKELMAHEGVNKARTTAQLRDMVKNKEEVEASWVFGRPAFYDTVKNVNLLQAFLGSYNILISSSYDPRFDSYTLTFKVLNESGWESGTRYMKAQPGQSGHAGIIPNKMIGKGIKLGGTLNQTWNWQETYPATIFKMGKKFINFMDKNRLGE